VQHELLVNRANQLLEKEHSGCRALLRDDKVFDCFVLLFYLMLFTQVKFSICFPLLKIQNPSLLQYRFIMWDFVDFKKYPYYNIHVKSKL
jgi:hypothetical protein